ncbi:UNKNOWN [Stylonychia lemnae]|uniref:Uncharacterized protein n=1 Tax=Stylonychia lemnae TaxID=5949 RepID=A0A078AJ55_STYLE|nr:UNKNOWN [Stylonychia lemnae]|eukprot:CDW80833.1 UNKNOWN [Stylonychia lemnae]
MNFFTSLVCCGKRNQKNDQYANRQQMEDLSQIDQSRILQYFNEFEGKLTWDLKKIPVAEFIQEAKLLASFDGSISTRQLSILYQKFNIQFTSLITIFAQEFFFKNQIGSSTEYDAVKMNMFNLLYCEGEDKAKLGLLYDLIMAQPEQVVAKKAMKPNDEWILRRLEYLIMIPSLLIANIIEQQNKLSRNVPEEKTILEEVERVQLLLIDSTSSQLREFAGMISREFFFQSVADRNQGYNSQQQRQKYGSNISSNSILMVLSKSEFIEKNIKIKFKITSPSEIRNRFLKMLEAKHSIMRNSINFTLINNRDSMFVSRDNAQNQGFGDFNFSSQVEEDFPDDMFSRANSHSKNPKKKINKNNKSRSQKNLHDQHQSQERSVEEQISEPKFTFENLNRKSNNLNERQSNARATKANTLSNPNSKRNSTNPNQVGLPQGDTIEKLNQKYSPELIKFYFSFLVEKTQESQTKINRNRDYLKSIPKFTFDLDRNIHPQVKQLIEYLKLKVSVQDVKDVDFGCYFGEDIYQVYLKMLEIFNLIAQDLHSTSAQSNQYGLRKTQVSQMQQNVQPPPKNMTFLGINEIMENQQEMAGKRLKKFKGFFEKNSVLAPVFFNSEDRKQAVLVHINPITLTAELYYKPNLQHDNSKLKIFSIIKIGDISEQVLNMLDQVGNVNGIRFDDDEVEGKIHEVEADTEEDMLVFACYIAECLTLRKEIDIQSKGVTYLRNRIVDSIINLTYI